MAFGDVLAYTDGAEGSPGLNLTCTSAMEVAVGDMLVVAMSVIANKTADGLGISDNLGNTWNLVGTPSYSTVTVAKWWCRVSNAGSLTPTVAWNTSTTGDGAIVCVKYAGPFAAGNPVDVTPANTADATSPYATSATGTLAQADELVVVAAGHSRGIVITPTDPMTKSREAMTGTGANTASCALLAKVVASTGTTTPGYTGSSYAGVQQIFSMKKAPVYSLSATPIDGGAAVIGAPTLLYKQAATPLTTAAPYQEAYAALVPNEGGACTVTISTGFGMTGSTHDLASVTGVGNVTLDTQLATASSNEVSTKVVNHVDLTMDGMTAACGEVTVEAKGTAQITGAIGATASTHDLANVIGKGNVTLDGINFCTGSVGDVSVQAKANVTLDTQLSTAGQGDEAVEAKGSVTLDTHLATGEVGDATAVAAQAVSVNLDGVAGTADCGSVTATITATVTLASFEATAQLGTLSTTGKASVQLEGFQGSGAAGDVTTAITATVQLTGAADPFTVALLHMDGADGSTSFTEEGGLAVTAVGNAQIDTAQAVFGSSSALFDGSGDYLTLPGGTAGLGTGDFVLEARVNRPTPPSWATIISLRENGGGGNIFFGFDAGGGHPVMHRDGTNRITGAALSPDTWYHLALVRSSGVDRMFIDGVQTGSDFADTHDYVAPTYIQIGAEATNGSNAYNGWIDELRITKGSDRGWFNGFTPPAAPYSLGGAALAGAIGSPSVSGKAVVALGGFEAAAAVGDTTTQAKANVTLAGFGTTASGGELTASALTQIALGSFEAAGQLGELSESGKAIVQLTQGASTAAEGTATPEAEATAQLAGHVASSAQGEASTLVAMRVQLGTPDAATGQVGNTSFMQPRVVELGGFEGSGAAGDIAPTTEQAIELAGFEATGAAGQVSVTAAGITSVDLTGFEAPAQLGTISLQTEQAVTLEGHQAPADVGGVAIALPRTITLAGHEASALPGAAAWLQANHADVGGHEAGSSVGAIAIALPRTVELSGHGAAAAVGDLSLTTEQTITLAGHQGDAAVGTPDISTAGNIWVNLSGLEAAAALGSPSLVGKSRLTLSGLGCTGQHGSVAISVAKQVTLDGHAATGAVGNVLAEIRTGATLDGFQADAGHGSVSVLAHNSAEATALTVQPTDLGEPALGQHHFLVSADLTVGSPELPLLMPGGFAAEAAPLTTGSPELGTPRVRLCSHFEALPLTVGSPQFIHPGAAVEIVALTLKIERGEAQLLIDVADAELDVQCGRVMLEVDYDWVQWWESAA